MFDEHAHITLDRVALLNLAMKDARSLVNDYLMVGTPFVFKTYEDYCKFRNALAEKLQVHPHVILIRGSAHLGYSIAPKVGKLWRPFDSSSDIDVAVVDVDYFLRLDKEIREWESRQSAFPSSGKEFYQHSSRRDYRRYNCVADKDMPPCTCRGHMDAVERFDTMQFCGNRRDVSCFIFRDWWSFRNRYEYDLWQLKKGIKIGTLSNPQ